MSIKMNWFGKFRHKNNPFGKDIDHNIQDTSNKQDVKRKIDTISLQEPIRKYFSSPCLLSEIEDDEDVLNW